MIQKPMRGVQLNKTHPLSRGLVACCIFNEATGETVFDLSGNGNNGTLENGTAWGNDGLEFDGVDDYVSLGTQTIYNAETISFWFNSNNITSTQRLFDGNYLGVYLNDTSPAGTPANSLVGMVHDGTQWNFVNWTVSNLNNNVWYNVAFTYNTDGNVKLYVNGNLKDTNTNYDGTVGSTSQPHAIGAHRYGNEKYFNGSIRSANIYNHALSAEEITQLHRKPYAMFEPTFNPAILYSPTIIMNQFQGVNLGADLYNGVIIS